MLPLLLIIADNPSVRFFFKKYLSPQFLIVEAEHDRAAIKELSSAKLELVVLDAQLTNGDALTLARTLRNKNLLVPILLITGRLKKSFRDTALDAGITDFLHIPLDLEEIETRIAILKKAQEAREKTAEHSHKIRTPKKSSATETLSKRKLTPTKKGVSITPHKKKNS